MGQVNNIKLKNYRNFNSFEIAFSPKCNVIFGKNGSGKTNILESISLLGKGRGFRNSNLFNLIYKDKKNFLIKSDFEKNKNIYNIQVYSENLNNKFKKITSLNNEISKESAEFIDTTISFLYFLPEMERLFLSSPSYRRNFIDKLIFSENKTYNKLINRYKKNLLERSKLLQLNNIDEDWINNIEKEISKIALEIYSLRKKKIQILNDQIINLNKLNNYPFNVQFKINDNFYGDNTDETKYTNILKEYRNIDTKLGGAKIGPHKSDIEALINNSFSASQLSTGQQKTLVLITLIAQCSYLVKNTNYKPILLFDEICSHLDEINRNILLEFTNEFDIQFFLTGTEKSLFSFISTNAKFYNINRS